MTCQSAVAPSFVNQLLWSMMFGARSPSAQLRESLLARSWSAGSQSLCLNACIVHGSAPEPVVA